MINFCHELKKMTRQIGRVEEYPNFRRSADYEGSADEYQKRHFSGMGSFRFEKSFKTDSCGNDLVNPCPGNAATPGDLRKAMPILPEFLDFACVRNLRPSKLLSFIADSFESSFGSLGNSDSLLFGKASHKTDNGIRKDTKT